MTLCRNPYIQGMHAHNCGQCMPCRIQRKRVWTHRIMLEATSSNDNTFCTLTYRDKDLPLSGSGLPTLEPKHLQDWLKRLRFMFAKGGQELRLNQPLRLRYYAVGEYGDETFRPHYHAALFGFPSCLYINSRYSLRRSNCCPNCDLVRDTWTHGQILLGTLEASSAGYMAGYVTKKMTRSDDPRLGDRYPEFSRMSLRPGIGAHFMHDVAHTLMRFNLEDDTQGDVPSSLRHGTRTLPLGRYLRRKLRTLVGKEPNAPQSAVDAVAQELRPLFLAARTDKENPSAKHHILEAFATKALSQHVKAKIYKTRKPL